MNVARLRNKYLTDAEAWKNFKEDPKQVATILNVCLQICANISVLGITLLALHCRKVKESAQP
jgi:methionyl-tRNA synthetase